MAAAPRPPAKCRTLRGDIFAPCAAAALYRRSAVAAIHGFDESYLLPRRCWTRFRLRLLGHTARYVPQAVVRHVGGATTGGQRSEFATYHGHRNMVYLVKNMPGPLLWARPFCIWLPMPPAWLG